MKMRTLLAMTILVATLLSTGFAGAAETANSPAAKTYRIAYLERGEFWLFSSTFKAFQQAIEDKALDVSFPAELSISPGWQETQQGMQAAARKILASKPDLVVAAGTGAVSALLNENNGITPILGIALADPMAAGFMRTPTEPIAENFFCEVIPDRWQKMYRVFHDVIGFKKLGIMYPLGEEGRLYSGVDDAYTVSREEGFEIVEVVIDDESNQSCRKGIDDLQEREADAFFIGPLNCFDWAANPMALIGRLNSEGIPTFARDGSAYVQAGALMGFSTWDFSPTGRKLADAAEKVFGGVLPKDISLVGVSEPLIALNLKTARDLGIDLPFDVLVAADQIYDTISRPEIQ